MHTKREKNAFWRPQVSQIAQNAILTSREGLSELLRRLDKNDGKVRRAGLRGRGKDGIMGKAEEKDSLWQEIVVWRYGGCRGAAEGFYVQ